MPAGLGILGISEKAIEAMKTSNYPTCYFDVADMIEKNRWRVFTIYTSGEFIAWFSRSFRLNF